MNVYDCFGRLMGWLVVEFFEFWWQQFGLVFVEVDEGVDVGDE